MKAPFCLLSLLPDTLHSRIILSQIHILLSVKLCDKIICDSLIKIISTQMIITGCGKHLYQIVPYFDNRHIEGSSSEVVDKNFLLLSVVQSVCECRRGWLIYDSKHIKPSNPSCILSCLPLRIRKYAGTVITASVTASPI